MKWNFLVVDDDSKMAAQTSEILSSNRTLPGSEIVCEICSSFEDAKQKVVANRYDLIVLDLQDDITKVEMKGKEILDVLRGVHFVPVIFYSGHAAKVISLETPLVRVVSKGDDDLTHLRSAVTEVFSTGLPDLIRFIQEQQRSYLWAHIDEFWVKNGPICDVKDLACLLSKRLSNALRGASVRHSLEGDETGIAHPIEMYVWPALGESLQTGDIVMVGEKQYVALNPACDFAQGKVESVVMAECIELEKCKEYMDLIAQKKTGTSYTGAQFSALKSLVSDNRQGKKVQADRFKYLPGTVFMNACVIDFQSITSFPASSLTNMQRIATLDTPFVESLLSKFSRYFGRIGTPNLDADGLSKAIMAAVL